MMVPRTHWSVLAVVAVFVVKTVAGCEIYGGIVGASTNDGVDVQVCCVDWCTDDTCAQDGACADRGGAENCCPDTIATLASNCAEDNSAPCIFAGTPAPTPAVSGQTDDDAIEDVEDDDPNSTEGTPMGAIVGGAVAGTLVIVAVILAVLFKTGRLKASRGSSSKTAADDVKPAPPSGSVPADDARSQASEGPISQHAGRPQYPVAHQYPQAL